MEKAVKWNYFCNSFKVKVWLTDQSQYKYKDGENGKMEFFCNAFKVEVWLTDHSIKCGWRKRENGIIFVKFSTWKFD